MIHALASFDGTQVNRSKTSKNTYVGYDGSGHWENVPIEELQTHGINRFNDGKFAGPGNSTRAKCPTENTLRAEHNLWLRAAYESIPGQLGK